ncbi:MAG: extracellular solute-binding protein [Anaeroplasma sp.]
MKRIFYLCFIMISLFILASCDSKGCDLLILNWGDYICDDIITAFEEEYNCNVRVATTDSNESMYSKILNRNAEYDLVVPSDYMIDQMHKDNLLLEIDYDLLENYNDDIFVAELQNLMDSDDCNSYRNYYIPYFWGSLGIMYSTKKYPELDEIVKEYEWEVLFNKDILPKNVRVGMYSSSRDALAAAELYRGYSLNTTNRDEIDDCMDLLASTDFYEWGTDDLKLDLSAGKIDIALVYSGDFFDAYYADLEAEGNEGESNTENYSIYSPTSHNNVFFDAMVIPNTCTNYELAHKFLDFMLDFDNSYVNAEFVGYCPTLKSVFDDIINDEEGWGDIIAIDSYNPTIIINTDNSWAEVYKYLGDETYAYIERKFTNVIFR